MMLRSKIIALLSLLVIYLAINKTTKVKLLSGHDIPVIGLGTFLIHADQIEIAVALALDSGYRMIDAAYFYGNEKYIGIALKKWFDKGGKREDLFLSSKLPPQGMRSSEVTDYLERTLKSFGVNYLDMFLLVTVPLVREIQGTLERNKI